LFEKILPHLSEMLSTTVVASWLFLPQQKFGFSLVLFNPWGPDLDFLLLL